MAKISVRINQGTDERVWDVQSDTEGKRRDFLLGDTVLSVGSICTVLIYAHYAD